MEAVKKIESAVSRRSALVRRRAVARWERESVEAQDIHDEQADIVRAMATLPPAQLLNELPFLIERSRRLRAERGV